MVSILGVALAMVLAAAPWLMDWLVQGHVVQQLHVSGTQYAHTLEQRLQESEQSMMFEAQAMQGHADKALDALVSRWLARDASILQIRLVEQDGAVLHTRLSDAAMSVLPADAQPHRMLAVQLLALQRVLETRALGRSALYTLHGRQVSDLYLPLGKRPERALAVTFDVQHWLPPHADIALPENIGVQALAYTTHTDATNVLLVNDPSWEGLWTLSFHNMDVTASVLQYLQPFFIVLALLLFALVYITLKNLRRLMDAESQLEDKSRLLDQQERLGTLGELSASIAHEINQPLAAISNFSASARLLLRSGKGASEVEPLLQRIDEQSQRAARVMKAVRALIHKGPIQQTELDLGGLLQQLQPHLQLLSQGQNITLSVHTARSLRVRGDATLLEQVFLNLVRNSVQALAMSQRTDKRIQVLATARDGMAHVSVRDNGPGIDPAVADHIFDSFFTTRTEGLGIGLNFCKSVLERLQGGIALQSEGGQGATFVVSIPLIRTTSP